MNNINKQLILFSILKLIDNYKSHKLKCHSIYSCPLCLIYYKDNNNPFEQSTTECTKCPNIAFTKSNDVRGCCQRGIDISNLSFYIEGYETTQVNDITLAEFWQNVHDLFVTKEESELLEMGEDLQQSIRDIANKYK